MAKGRNEKPHFEVTAGLVWKDGQVLVAKRPEGSHLAGMWEFPGGKKERGESTNECVEREIQEELGIKVKAEKAFMRVEHDYGSKSITLHVHNCTCIEGVPKPLQCAEVKWIDPIDLKRLTLPPPDAKIVDVLCRSQFGPSTTGRSSSCS
jgi:mutator protein MutT